MRPRLRATRTPSRVTRGEAGDPVELVILLRAAAEAVERSVLGEAVALVEPRVGLHGFLVLRRLSQRSESATDLADYLCLTRPTVARVVSRLEALGYVEKHGSWRDGRVTVVGPTEEGLDLVDEMSERATHVMGRMLGRADIGDPAPLAGQLAALVDAERW